MSRDRTTISTHDVLHRLIQRWWLALAVGVVGAAIGLCLSTFIPARYEAIAVITISIDYGRTEELDLVVEDRVLDRVWVLFTSLETLEETQSQLQREHGGDDAWKDLPALEEHIRLDGYFSRWYFIGVDPDPVRAAWIANAWRDVSFSRLEEAMDHAWTAQAIQGVKFDVTCVEANQGQPVEAIWQCYTFGPDVTQDQINGLRSEIDASHGILPVLSYEIGESATPPGMPVQWQRGVLVLAGGMLGLIIGVAFALASNRSKG
jgi:hypothetical protein